MLTLIIGGARSGKSRFAQALCRDKDRVVFIATAQPVDEEMERRIERHRQTRPGRWHTVEEPLALVETVSTFGSQAAVVLVDCLTLWLSNFCFERRACPPASTEQALHSELDRLVAASRRTQLLAVTNEVGSGIVPESAVARSFCDLQGAMNQRLADAADQVFFTVAGIAMPLKQNGVAQ